MQALLSLRAEAARVVSAPTRSGTAASLLGLDASRVLDTAGEPVLDVLVRSAAFALRCPIALVTLLEPGNGWLDSSDDDGDEVDAPTVDFPFCRHTVEAGTLLEVSDTRLDERFATLDVVRGSACVRFYAGVPLLVDERPVGVLCVIDRHARTLSDEERALLRDLGGAVQRWITSWHEQRALERARAQLDAMSMHAPGAFFELRRAPGGPSRLAFVTSGVASLLGLDARALERRPALALQCVKPEFHALLKGTRDRSAAMLTPWFLAFDIQRPDGTERRLELHATPRAAPRGTIVWHGWIADVTLRHLNEAARLARASSERALVARDELRKSLRRDAQAPLDEIFALADGLAGRPGAAEGAAGQGRRLRDAAERLRSLLDGGVEAAAALAGGAPGVRA